MREREREGEEERGRRGEGLRERERRGGRERERERREREREGEEERGRGRQREKWRKTERGEGSSLVLRPCKKRNSVSHVAFYKWHIQCKTEKEKSNLQPFLTTYGCWLPSVELSAEDWGGFRVW